MPTVCGSGKPLVSERLMKSGHLLRSPHSASLRRTSVYASFLGISAALHLAPFDQPLRLVSLGFFPLARG
jgi:hypothetical protein